MITNRNRNYKAVLLCFLFLSFVFLIEANATIRYVSPTGNNIPPYLTWEDAANSIQDAIDICEPGDTVLVDNGVYKENLVINSIPIYLLGSSMDSTVIDGTGLSDSTIFFNNSNSTIENFNICGRGIGSYSYAVAYRGLPLTIKSCRISKTGYGVVSIGNAGVSAYKIILETITKHGFSLFNNSNNIISDCIIVLNTSQAQGIHIGGPNPNSVYTITNNIIIFTNPVNFTAQTGIYSGLPGKVYIYNNLISGFTENIYIDGVADTVFIKNNALMHQYSGSSNPASILSGIHHVFVNNVVLSKNKKGINGNYQVRTDYNLFWENTTDLVGMIYGDSDRVADPMFVKDTLPTSNGNYDFHLQAFSPGIDAGDPDILDVDASRSDIGLYGGPFGQSYKYIDLPPKPPVNLSAIVDTNGILLNWNRNSEADTAHYNVYKDTVTNFTIDSTKLIASPVDTFFLHLPPYSSNQFVYKITCVDNQGNESLPSEEIVVKPVSVDEYPFIVNDYILYQNYPNPFNPSTTIGYKLKERGYVKLMVYDITGALVSVLVNKEQEAGYYELEFNSSGQPALRNFSEGGLASGIYLYRIEVIGKGNMPVYSDMKKMILVK